MGKPEGAVEDYLIKQADRYGCMCVKFVSPSRNGVPDRILIGHGKTVFVELKAPGETPEPHQKAVIRAMREHGATVCVVDTKPGVDRLLSDLFPGRTPRKDHGSKVPANAAVFADLT